MKVYLLKINDCNNRMFNSLDLAKYHCSIKQNILFSGFGQIAPLIKLDLEWDNCFGYHPTIIAKYDNLAFTIEEWEVDGTT